MKNKKQMKRRPQILIFMGTHGDEKIGFLVKKHLDRIPIKRGSLEFIVGNPDAVKNKKRYIDQDLNRSFPGNIHGNYEQRRAATLLPKIKNADIVIDIHSTTSQLRDAIIVTKINKKIKKLLHVINPAYVLYMSATGTSPLIYNAKVGIAFEYGKDSDKRTITKTVDDIISLLQYVDVLDVRPRLKKKQKTTFFKVIKSFPKQKGFSLLRSVKNYILVKKGSVVAQRGIQKIIATEDFYPILFGQKNYKDIFGFMAKKMDA